MVSHIRTLRWQWALPILIGICVLLAIVIPRYASAINQIPTPEPQPGSYGVQATKTQDPPTVAASITSPGANASFANSPITVGGLCPNELLVQIYNNGVMVGSVICEGGSFSLQVSLFAGINELTAIVYDDLEQAGPVSNIATVNYTDTSFTAFGELITLTSSYGRRSAAAGSQLTWPLQLSGGTGPYAFSIDWGDGSDTELKSQALAGLINIAHVYKNAGIYQVNIKVTDTNGVSAFLQVIAVSSGEVTAQNAGPTEVVATPQPAVLWIPAAIALALVPVTYWIGRRSQIVSLRHKMLKERDSYKEE